MVWNPFLEVIRIVQPVMRGSEAVPQRMGYLDQRERVWIDHRNAVSLS